MRLLVLALHLAGAPFAAATIVYITELPAFSSLAPCAAQAVSSAVQRLTTTACPTAVTALESCACTKNQNSVGLISQISSGVLQGCGTTAAEQIASAAGVFGSYCNQEATTTAPSQSVPTVSQYITELPAYQSLAPCAAGAISTIFLSLTTQNCPTPAPDVVNCACSKDQNSLAISQSINAMVSQSCGSTNTENVASAQAVFSGYCDLRGGVAAATAIPTPTSTLSGDVTYYITDLPDWSSLAPCAASVVSRWVQTQTYQQCQPTPRSLVSCVCFKDRNSMAISGYITSDVRKSCTIGGGPVTEDITSAIRVLDEYCSAGKGLITPTGVMASGPTSTPSGQTSSTPAGVFIGSGIGGFVVFCIIVCCLVGCCCQPSRKVVVYT